MKEVAPRIYQVLVDALKAQGVSSTQLMDFLPAGFIALLYSQESLDWESFIALCERVEQVYQGDLETVPALETWFEFPHLLNGLWSNPYQLYRQIEKMLPSALPLSVQRQPASSDFQQHLRVNIVTPSAASYAFLRLLGEALRRAPRVLQLDDALLEVQLDSVRTAHYRLTLHPAATFIGRLQMAYQFLVHPGKLRREFQRQIDQAQFMRGELARLKQHNEDYQMLLLLCEQTAGLHHATAQAFAQEVVQLMLRYLPCEGVVFSAPDSAVSTTFFYESGKFTSKMVQSYPLHGETARLDVWWVGRSLDLAPLVAVLESLLQRLMLSQQAHNLQAQLIVQMDIREKLLDDMRLAEGRWRTLVEDAPAVLTILDRNGNIEYTNYRYGGMAIEKVLGTSIYDYSPLESHENISKAFQRAEKNAQPETYEHIATNEQGKLAWYESRLSPVIRRGKVVNFTLISNDITLRRNNDEEIRNRAKEMETLADVSSVIIRTLDPQELMDLVCEVTKKQFDFYHVQVYLLNENGRTLTLAAGTGTAGQNLVKSKWSFTFNTPKQGLVVQSARTRSVVLSNDVSKDNRFFYNMYLPRTRSELALPMIVGERLIGVLDIQADKANRFNQSDLKVMETLTAQVAVALNNAQLFAKLKRQNEIADTLRDISVMLNSTLDLRTILQRILDQVKRVLPYDAANVRLDDGTGRFYAVAWVGYERFGGPEVERAATFTPEDSRLLRMMVNEKRSLIVSDLSQEPQWAETSPGFDWVQSWAGTPIVVEDRLVGMVSLDHTQTGFYTAQHLPLLESLRIQVSIAVSNARLFEAERRRRQEIESVQRSSLSLTSMLELSQVLEAIVAAVVDLTKADDVHIFLYDGDELRFGAGLHLGEHLQQAFIEPRPNGVTYHVARTGEQFVVNNVQQHPLYQGQHFEFMSAIMGLPLKIGERVVGVMNIVYAEPHHFEEVTMQALQLLVNQASIAIENARLYETVSEYAERMADRVRERTYELERERAQLQAILDSMGEGVVYDENLTIKYYNRALREITGYENSGWKNYSEMMASLIPEEKTRSHLIESLYRSIDRQEAWCSEVVMHHQDGSPFTARIICHPVIDALGSITGAVMLMQDISADKELEAQKDRFIAHASHELRTPLANLKTRLYLLKRQPEKQDYHLKIMEHVSEQMSELVEDLLDVSRFQRGVLEMEQHWHVIQELLQFVHEVQMMEAEKKQITFTKIVPETPLQAWVDLRRLRQVVTNLVINAINYTPAGGQMELRLVEDGDFFEIQVQDNGIGIAPEHHQQVFEPFFRATQSTERGTGLGLAITYQIVKLHQGDILLESDLGKGSLFRVRLPIHPIED